MDLSLVGKRALVCGASRGIGRACAEELAGLGASVTAAARDEGVLQEVVCGMKVPGTGGGGAGGHEVFACDFSDPVALEAAMVARFGAKPAFDIFVNNTGGPPGGRAIDATGEHYAAAFRMHVVAGQTVARLVVPHMLERGWGRIVNIISTSVKAPIPGLGVSNTIRAAVANWAKTLAGELGSDGITVNNVLPGYTETERLANLMGTRAKAGGKTEGEIAAEWKATIPAGRFGRPEEIAAVVAFLCSPAAGYVNGVNVPVDGGRTPGL
ncbi:MAG: SDR family oxidoreductase [Phycisphaerales bacterium]